MCKTLQNDMHNHSLTTLRQIALANISPRNADSTHKQGFTHSPSSSTAVTSPKRSHSGRFLPEISEDEARPPPLRRRSTRDNQLSESPLSRGGRLELALSEHCVESFFVLYAEGEKLYISEIVPGKSPQFTPFQLDSHASLLRVVVYLRSPAGTWRKFTEEDVDTSRLKKMSSRPSVQIHNVILLQFTDHAWYSPHHLPTTSTQDKAESVVSYSVSQVLRLQSSTEFTNDALQSIAMMKNDIEQLLHKCEQRKGCLNEISSTDSRLSSLRSQIKLIKARKHSETVRRQKLRDTLDLRVSLMQSSSSHITTIRAELTCSCKTLVNRHQTLDLLSSEIRRCQRQVSSIAAEIFPIRTDSIPPTIRGLRTAINSDYTSHSHEHAAALGYIAHFLFILSHYLSIPLRYPVRPVSSNSYIFDPISNLPTSGEQREGPSYSTTQDRRYPLFWQRRGGARLQWAVFLLNKNIEQLLQARGLVCGDLRHTLHNLEFLIVWLKGLNEEEDVSLSTQARQTNGDHSGRPSNGVDHHLEGREHLESYESIDIPSEITDVTDLLALQLSTKMHSQKGKAKLAPLTEKEEHENVGYDKRSAIN